MTSPNRQTPLILVTNDDGYDAPGIEALTAAVGPLGELLVVAPEVEVSGISHALTIDRPLRIRNVGPGRYRVTGTPADCVHLGVLNLADGRRPDLVVSGINDGMNIGDDVTYSGTVAGALEGTLLHIPSIAFSTERNHGGETEFGHAARFAATLCAKVLERGLDPGVFLSVNVPAGEPNGVRITRQGSRSFRAAAVERTDPAGKPYFWIAGEEVKPETTPDEDHRAISNGSISITPLYANMTHEPALDVLAGWDLEVK